MSRRIPRKPLFENLEKHTAKKKPQLGKNLLDSLDESPEFYDPYSELNLFLSQRIKREIHHCSNPKKWSTQLQDELVHKITPEFQQRFPKYHLGVSALKKTWEKVQYYSAQIQEEKEALTQDGKFNLPYFIKENLKATNKLQNACHLHPCHYAHQLAVKMSECIAVVDGIRPKIDQLTQTIWSLQRHLIPKLAPEHFKSPYDENEKVDKLIVKSILEIGAKHPEVSQAELVFHVQKRLIQLKAVASTYSLLQLRKILTALIADQNHTPSMRVEKTLEKIPYPTARCLKSELALILIDTPSLTPEEAIEKTLEFFQKVDGALKNFEEDAVERKIQNWTIQGEMLLRWVRLNAQSVLLREVESVWSEEGNVYTTISVACKQFVDKYPSLISYAKEVETRAWIFLKYLWYTQTFDEETSTYDRFILWHKKLLQPQALPPDLLIQKIESTCKKMLPLIPFNRTRAQTILVKEKEKNPYYN